MDEQEDSSGPDSLDEFQVNIDAAISGIDAIRHFRTGSTRRKRPRRKPGPKNRKATNLWYHLPLGSPVPNFQKRGQGLLEAHRREGYGFSESYCGPNGNQQVTMPLDMTQQQLSTKLYEMFPNLRQKQFQIFKLNRQRVLVPLEENHPRALCPTGSKSRYRGTVFVKEKNETEEVDVPQVQVATTSTATPRVDVPQVQVATTSTATPRVDVPQVQVAVTSAATSMEESQGEQSVSAGQVQPTSSGNFVAAGTPTEESQGEQSVSAGQISSASSGNFVAAGTPTVLIRRQLIEEQDQAFQESLRVDRERDAHIEEQANRERQRQRAIEERRCLLSDEPDTGSLIQIRFPDGGVARRRFDLSQNIQTIVNYIGTNPSATETFSIYVAGQTISSNSSGSCESYGVGDRMSVFVAWQSEHEQQSSVLTAAVETNSNHDTLSLCSSFDFDPPDVDQVDDSDWKAELLQLQSHIAVASGAPIANCINVTRDRILECAQRAINRKKFEPLKPISVVFVDAIGISEGGIDNGGLTREFLRLLMKEAIQCHIFEGPDDARQLTLSTQAVRKNTYKDVGSFISLSLLHGGPSPKCLSKGLYKKIVKPHMKVQSSLDDIKDEHVRDGLRKIRDAVSLEDAMERLTQNRDLLAVLGSIRHLRSLDDRDKLVHDAVDFYLFGRMQIALDQFMEGLKLGGVLTMLQNNPDGFEHLFVKQEGATTIEPTEILALFQPTLSASGSNKRTIENRILSFWRDWLIDIADGDSQVTLGQLLVFATAADEIPPLGFPVTPGLEFIHDRDCRFPTANTCGLVLRLPVHQEYEAWTAAMVAGIIQSPIIGVN